MSEPGLCGSNCVPVRAKVSIEAEWPGRPFGTPVAFVAGMPDEPKHFVYVLESTRNRDHHYTGLTSDVPARLSAHNNARSLHTAKHGPWKLLVAMEFTDATVAASFERYLKTGSGRAFARRHF